MEIQLSHIQSPFGFHSTAAEVMRGLNLSGKRVVVTGGASGIGSETARAFAACGAEVTLAVRNVDAGNAVGAQIAKDTGNAEIHVRYVDLGNRASIAAFVAAWKGALDILVNNAGIMALPQLERTAEGYEMQFATNHLGHFELAVGLHAALARAGAARIVSLSSSGHLLSPVVFDDLHFAFRPYEPFAAYGQSKSATVLFAVGATARWAADGITANAVMPGAIATNLQRHTGGLKTPPERRKTVEQGAATTVFVATSPLLDGIGGRYFEDVNEAPVVDHRGPDYTGVAPYALDCSNANRLWETSLRLIRDDKSTS